MKILLISLFIVPVMVFGQRHATFEKIPFSPASYNSYTAKNGSQISYKDSIKIGAPSGPNGFRYITRQWLSAKNIIAGKKVAIHSIRSFKRRKLRNKIFIEIRPYGLAPFFVDYEMALESGEIKSNLEE